MRYLFWVAALLLPFTVYADPRDDVKIISVQAKQLGKLGDRTAVTVKADVENMGKRGSIFVNVVGKDSSGFQVALAPVYGFFEAGQTKSLTKVILINPANGEIVSWEADSYGKEVAP